MILFNRLPSNPRQSFAIACLTIGGCSLTVPPCWAQLGAASTEVARRAQTAGDVAPDERVLEARGLAAVPLAPAADKTLSRQNRVMWAVESSVGMKSLGAGAISAGWGVARDSPDEYGANWRGFGKRYALRLSGVTIGNSIEAGLGGLWGEDPRYERAGEGSFWSRLGRAGKMDCPLASPGRPDAAGLRPRHRDRVQQLHHQRLAGGERQFRG